MARHRHLVQHQQHSQAGQVLNLSFSFLSSLVQRDYWWCFPESLCPSIEVCWKHKDRDEWFCFVLIFFPTREFLLFSLSVRNGADILSQFLLLSLPWPQCKENRDPPKHFYFPLTGYCRGKQCHISLPWTLTLPGLQLPCSSSQSICDRWRRMHTSLPWMTSQLSSAKKQ